MTGADLDPGCPLDDTGGGEWARPLDDGAWVGPDGVTWRRRGDREGRSSARPTAAWW